MAAYRFRGSHGASWKLEARLYVTVKAGRQVQVMRQALRLGKMSLKMSLPDPEAARPLEGEKMGVQSLAVVWEPSEKPRQTRQN